MLIRLSPKYILPLIVLAQFFCVSLWFAGNGVMSSLLDHFALPAYYLGHLTSAVQLGFIAGTLFYAVLSFADRYSPSFVFFISSLLAAGSNLGLAFSGGYIEILLSSRFLTGFFLAGIYPVGMKIASDYYDKDLGKALGFLLGALVLGTAFPHLLRGMFVEVSWEHVIVTISILAVVGGLLILLFIPDGPFRKRGQSFKGNGISQIFRSNSLRSAAFGYFGHMWELYAFWAFVPFVVSSLITSSGSTAGQTSLISFAVIAIGSLGCVLGGYLAGRIGSYRVAFFSLTMSCLCCVLSPLFFTLNAAIVFIFLLFWGIMVIMDSPQFSTLVAQSAPLENKGSALTIINCIGFSITIISIQLITFLSENIPIEWLFVFLFPGPALGLWMMVPGKAGKGIIQKSIP